MVVATVATVGGEVVVPVATVVGAATAIGAAVAAIPVVAATNRKSRC